MILPNEIRSSFMIIFTFAGVKREGTENKCYDWDWPNRQHQLEVHVLETNDESTPLFLCLNRWNLSSPNIANRSDFSQQSRNAKPLSHCLYRPHLMMILTRQYSRQWAEAVHVSTWQKAPNQLNFHFTATVSFSSSSSRSISRLFSEKLTLCLLICPYLKFI